METSSNSYVASWSGATSKATASHLPAVLNTTSLRLILSYITASDRLAKGSSSGGNTVERLVTGAHLEGGKRIGHGKTFTAEKRRIDSDEGWIVIKRTKVGKEDSEGTLATRIQVAFLEQHILSYYSEISEHPNIIKYHGWGWTLKDLDRAAAVSLFLALEYCEMGTLSSFLRNTAGLSDTQKWQFCLGISRGLEVLHKHGIAHGDVKLANILVTYDHVQDMPIAKISDFGNARLCEALPNIAGLLQFTDYLGTHMYNAPEVQAQFGGATKVTAELFPYCDIFSFGLCCIEVFNNGNRYDTHMEKGEEMKRLLFSFRGSEPKMTQKLKDVEFNQSEEPVIALGKEMVYSSITGTEVQAMLSGVLDRTLRMAPASRLSAGWKELQDLGRVHFEVKDFDIYHDKAVFRANWTAPRTGRWVVAVQFARAN